MLMRPLIACQGTSLNTRGPFPKLVESSLSFGKTRVCGVCVHVRSAKRQQSAGWAHLRPAKRVNKVQGKAHLRPAKRVNKVQGKAHLRPAKRVNKVQGKAHLRPPKRVNKVQGKAHLRLAKRQQSAGEGTFKVSKASAKCRGRHN
eukprot:1158501-Pelagomonas_calceolata.AAC.5